MKYSALWVALQVLVVVAAPNPALSGKTRTSGVIGGSRLADLVGGTRANRDVASNNNADTTGEVSHAIGDQLGENEGGHVRGRFGRLGGIGAGRQTGGGGGLFRGFGSAGSNTFNEALPGNPCKPVTVVFARFVRFLFLVPFLLLFSISTCRRIYTDMIQWNNRRRQRWKYSRSTIVRRLGRSRIRYSAAGGQRLSCRHCVWFLILR